MYCIWNRVAVMAPSYYYSHCIREYYSAICILLSLMIMRLFCTLISFVSIIGGSISDGQRHYRALYYGLYSIYNGRCSLCQSRPFILLSIHSSTQFDKTGVLLFTTCTPFIFISYFYYYFYCYFYSNRLIFYYLLF
ncbi:hypothetical protein BDF19DRAFT_432346 [Syncephalis fuscata]|nr:hypothetical protein BDF19DRAFT_432346 [Syncephalis fuscata]